jgi:hypothetical protein
MLEEDEPPLSVLRRETRTRRDGRRNSALGELYSSVDAYEDKITADTRDVLRKVTPPPPPPPWARATSVCRY